MKFSKREIMELLKAWIMITIAFTILFKSLLHGNYVLIFALSAVTAGLGFLLHELAHKFYAQRYGFYAEFRSFNIMLILAIFFSFFGFIFAAPGAVFIKGNITKRQNGIISIAGPITNIILAILFAGLLNLGLFSDVSYMGFRINSLLAFFNMLPFSMFDGNKVLKWNKIIYIATILFSLGLMLIPYL